MRVPSATSLRNWMCEHVAKRLKVNPRDIDPDAEFTSLGLDSMAVVDMSGELERSFGITLDPTIIYDFPTVNALATELAGALRSGDKREGALP